MAKKKPALAQATIPVEQWDLPVAIGPAGEFLTLREVSTPGHKAARSLASLAPDKKAELTIKRIEALPKFDLGMIGSGVVSKEQAIDEVRAQTEIGKVLTEIEQRTIKFLLEKVGA